MNPFFSIIIPVYNVSSFLRECLDSVLAQTFAGWEAICVDDGSTDGSGVILDEYAAHDSRFRVVHQVNAGVSAARNAALDKCIGAMVFFLDADDVIHFQALEYLHAIAVAVPGVDIIRTYHCEFAEHDSPLFNHSVLSSAYMVIDISKRIEVAEVFELGVCPVAFKRNLTCGVYFKNMTYAEDRLFGAEMLAKGSKIVLSSGKIYGYRQRMTSAMHKGVGQKLALDIVTFRRNRFPIFIASGKIISKKFFRSGLLAFLFDVVHLTASICAEERIVVWRETFAALRSFGGLCGMPHSFRGAAYLLGVLRSRIVVCTLVWFVASLVRWRDTINQGFKAVKRNSLCMWTTL